MYNKNMKIIDIHIHGGYGINFNTANKDEIIFLLKKLKERNIIGICPTLVGDKKENIQKQLKIFDEIKQEQLNNKTNGAFIIGAHLEGSFLNPKKPGIQSPDVFLEPTIENFKNLVGEYENIIKIVTLAPELDKENKLTTYLENKNIRAHAGHTLTENSGKTTGTTHHFNAMPNISHRGENLALDTLFNGEIYCEIIADLIHVSKNMLKLFFKIKNKDKIILVSDALPCAKSDCDIIFCGKKISKEGKGQDGTLAGSIMLLDEIVKNILDLNLLKIEDLKKALLDNPIEHLKLNENELKMLENKA